MDPLVSIVVVHYRAESLLAETLRELASTPYPFEVELIVVDNASIADSGAWRAAFPDVRWSFEPENRGFSAGANAGARLARGEHLLVLNPDARPVGDCLARLVAVMEGDLRIGLVGPQLLSPDGAPLFSADDDPTLARILTGHVGQAVARLGRRAPAATGELDVDWVSGAAMLCRRRAWDDAGGMDEGFFLYYEDCDLGLRLRRKGWRVVFLPSARAIHLEGASFGPQRAGRDRAFRDGQDRYFRKHRSAPERVALAAFRRVYHLTPLKRSLYR